MQNKKYLHVNYYEKRGNLHPKDNLKMYITLASELHCCK